MPGGLTIRRKRKESARSQVLVSNFLDSFFLISFWVYTKKKGRSKNAITGTVHWIKKKNWQWTLCPWSSVLNLWPTFHLLLQSEDVGSKVGWWSPRNPETVVWADHGKRKTSAQNTAQDRDFTIRYRPSHRHQSWLDGEDGIYLFPIPARALTYSTKKKESRTVLWLMTVGIGKRWRRRLEGTSGQI